MCVCVCVRVSEIEDFTAFRNHKSDICTFTQLCSSLVSPQSASSELSPQFCTELQCSEGM